jgi:hypothetical protein
MEKIGKVISVLLYSISLRRFLFGVLGGLAHLNAFVALDLRGRQQRVLPVLREDVISTYPRVVKRNVAATLLHSQLWSAMTAEVTVATKRQEMQ